MASASAQKKVTSSVFITLAAPRKVSGSQQQSSVNADSARGHQQSGPGRGRQQEDAAGHHDNRPVSSEAPAFVQKPPAQPSPPRQQPEEKDTRPPSSGFPQLEQFQKLENKAMNEKSHGSCAFCRKHIPLSERVITALNKIYHDGCFQCRTCNTCLTGKEFYNHSGVPTCEDCHEASLELCWACGYIIKDQILRAINRAYHQSCFVCKTCKREIGTNQSFAQGDVGEVYCLQDYYRKYAPQCAACNQQILPKEDGTDIIHVACNEQTYHESCYRCQVCGIMLSLEPNEYGCYPLDGKILCKPCNISLAK